ncbi:hypothetical protein M407DRAFT_13258 [Tulasnella calospora MUT 4182]|uniref:Uncharacterized protein n=1 Tax=Tulasnella calospora MUT 4182 TaxID=1051891 RepID=A0A0C3L199_9AGAM|nr:hypothetical protein M407DRAFT_13258 [Tulasnella calospora MUT 4182]
MAFVEFTQHCSGLACLRSPLTDIYISIYMKLKRNTISSKALHITTKVNQTCVNSMRVCDGRALGPYLKDMTLVESTQCCSCSKQRGRSLDLRKFYNCGKQAQPYATLSPDTTLIELVSCSTLDYWFRQLATVTEPLSSG